MQNLTNSEDIKDFYEYTEDCLKRIIKLKIPSIDDINDLLIKLPFEKDLKKKKLAVFDLDETLVHCEIKNPSKGQVQIDVIIPSGEKAKIGLNVRPFWKECLQEISKHYLIIVYTASHQSYADSVLNYLDPNKELIKYRLYRHNCVQTQMENESIYVKDLRIFKNVKMENMIIIDNSVLSFAFQLENGIPILPYYDNKEDIELKFLSNYLVNICNSQDLRIENIKSIKMDYFLNAVKEKVYTSQSSDDKEIEEKISINNINNNSTGMFKINLFSEEINNQNEVSVNSGDHDSSVYESECSINEMSVLNNTNSSINSQNQYFNSNIFNKKTEENYNSENSYCDDLSHNRKNNKNNKRNNNFQDKLFLTLDELRNTFTKLSERRKKSIDIVNQ